MVNDPYQILGVPKGATKEEIKKAYRQKAKQYHPDLHPDDPAASQKMNEVNEAYDMLMNPQKYEARRAQQRQSYGQSGQYGGYTGNQSGGYSGTGYERQGSSGGYRGPGGWSSDFGGFDFGDIFGFGFERNGNDDTVSMNPQPEPGDNMEIRQVITEINNHRYQGAIQILTHIPSVGRNARWYYLSALANHGLGNTVQAIDHMQKASQMEPNNRTYHLLLQKFRRSEQTYEQNAKGFNMEAANIQKICFGFLAIQFLCGPMGCLRCM